MRGWGVVIVAAAFAAALPASGYGTDKPTRPLHVTMLSLAADSGFPGPASKRVTLWQGYKRFASIARLVPLPLPAPLSRPKTGMTICVPVMLTIRLSDRHNRIYRGCQRPPSLRPVLSAMCPLLRQPGFCTRYHAELAPVRR